MASPAKPAIGLILLLALAPVLPAAGDETAWLERIETTPVSAATATAALALGTAWLRDGDWEAASEALQEALEVAVELDETAVATRAGQLLSAIHRLHLRPIGGSGPWRTARVFQPRGLTLKKPAGVAARGDGELLVVDENLDLVIAVTLGGAIDRRWSVARAERPSWSPTGEVQVETRTGLRELTAATAPAADATAAPAGTRGDRVVDVARDNAGDWWVLKRDPVLIRMSRGGAPLGSVALPDMRRPAALSVDALGNQYVLDRGEKRVIVLRRTGGVLATLGPSLPGGVELSRPVDIAVDQTGRLFIADTSRGLLVLE